MYTATFPQPHLTNLRHLQCRGNSTRVRIWASIWQPLPVNVTQINHQFLFAYQVETRCIPATLLLDRQTNEVCGQSVAFRRTYDQVHESWESY